MVWRYVAVIAVSATACGTSGSAIDAGTDAQDADTAESATDASSDALTCDGASLPAAEQT